MRGQRKKKTDHFKFFFHGSCDVDGFLFHVFDGEHATLVNADRGEYRRITEIRVRIRAQRHLTSPDQRMQSLRRKNEIIIIHERKNTVG